MEELPERPSQGSSQGPPRVFQAGRLDRYLAEHGHKPDRSVYSPTLRKNIQSGSTTFEQVLTHRCSLVSRLVRAGPRLRDVSLQYPQ